MNWTPAKWKELERKEQKRRTVAIDRSNLEVNLPGAVALLPGPPPLPLPLLACRLPTPTAACTRSPLIAILLLTDGDSTRGWRWHWRRGVYGFLSAWAAGSLGVVIFILAECVLHFDVVTAVGKKLGLVMSAEGVKQAEVDAYIVERIKAVLYVIKYCQSEQARIEYGIILAALAPERLAERSIGGMIRKVAERIGVQRGTRSYKSAYYNGRFSRELEPRPFDQGITRRAGFDEESARTGKLAAGDAAIATSSCAPCTVIEIDHESKACTLEF